MEMTSQSVNHLVKLRYWFKFDNSIITSSGVMTLFFYTGFTRSQEVGNMSEFCAISGDWGKLEIQNLAQKCFIKCY